jgi:hypothetical protein
MKSKPKIVIFFHTPAMKANKLATESNQLREDANHKKDELEEHQENIPDESNAKVIADIILTVIAMVLLTGNIMLDAPAIQNIFDLKDDKIVYAFIITLALIFSAMLFGIMIEEGIEPRLSASNNSRFATLAHESLYKNGSVNYKRWLLCSLGIVGSLAMLYAIYKLNIARFEMASNLGEGNLEIEKQVIFLPLFLYSAEVISSISLLGTFTFLHNLIKSKRLSQAVLQKVKEAQSIEAQAVGIWSAYILDLQEYNEKSKENKKAIPPNKYLKKLLDEQEAEEHFHEEPAVQDAEIENDIEDKDESFEFGPIENNPL